MDYLIDFTINIVFTCLEYFSLLFTFCKRNDPLVLHDVHNKDEKL